MGALTVSGAFSQIPMSSSVPSGPTRENLTKTLFSISSMVMPEGKLPLAQIVVNWVLGSSCWPPNPSKPHWKKFATYTIHKRANCETGPFPSVFQMVPAEDAIHAPFGEGGNRE